MGCVCEWRSGQRLYFAGDTGYNPFDFKEIGKKLGPFDLSLLPIGVYAPRKFMQPIHVNPAESLQIHGEVGSKLSVGGHWGTFRLSAKGWVVLHIDLFCCPPKKQKSAQKNSAFLNPGQTINW